MNNVTTYSYPPDGLSGIVRYDSRTSTYTPYAVETDHLGSITALYNSSGTKVMGASFDAWGKRTQTTSTLEFRRGFTGHEHIDGFDLINMNGRVYDPLIGRFLSPDMYVQLPGFSQSFNRYSYCLNNPLKYTDPDGESIIGAVIIGAIIGAYSGGVLANEGQFNPIDWDWESSRTWGYMAGGMITGALSGAAGAAIASSGIPMANTLSIMGGSLTNSLGTYAYTGGQTDITMSFGFASYNFTQKTWGCLGKEGNSTLDNIGYAMGALGNISDLLVGSQQPKTVELQTENNPLPNDIDPFGHSQIVDLNGEIIIDFGPQERGQLWGKEGRNNWVEHASYDPNLQKSTITQVKNISGNKITEGFKISGINGRRLANIGFKLDNNPGRYILGVRSCSNVAARALTLSGAPMVGLHPYLLHIQAKMWSVGIRPWTMSNYNFNY